MARKNNPSAYHLIDEERHGFGHHFESTWDSDHRGAGEKYPPGYHDRFAKSEWTAMSRRVRSMYSRASSVLA